MCYRLYIYTRSMLLVYAMTLTMYGIFVYTIYITILGYRLYIYTRSMLLVYAMVLAMYGICIDTKYI
jgi:hypothetical protein